MNGESFVFVVEETIMKNTNRWFIAMMAILIIFGGIVNLTTIGPRTDNSPSYNQLICQGSSCRLHASTEPNLA